MSSIKQSPKDINEISKSIKDETIIEPNHFLAEGKPVIDLVKKRDYIIKDVSRAGILLEHQPDFNNEPKERDLLVGYDELIKAFIAERFFIKGFSDKKEDGIGLNQNLVDLKNAILYAEHVMVLDEKERLKKEVESLKSHKNQLERKVLKGRTRSIVKVVKKEELQLQAEEAQRQREQQELEQNERQKAHNNKMNSLGLKQRAQQQSLRIKIKDKTQ